MLLSVLGIVVGLVALTYAADQFVVGAARMAIHLRISTIVVGAVVIGFGTSAPELLVSGLAGAQGAIDLAIANIVGSNIANLTLVLGIAALVAPIAVRASVLKREAPLSLFAVVAFGLLVQGGVGWFEGVVLALILVTSLTIIIVSARRGGTGDAELGSEVEEFLADGEVAPGRESLRTVLGLLGTLGAAQVLVLSATNIADELGLSQGFIGITVVAIGTSLPELATSVQAARKGETDLIIGNLLGSNLFNAGAVGATAAFAGVGQVASRTITHVGVPMMIGIVVIATYFMVTGKKVVRWEGAVLLAVYAATLPLVAG